MKNAYTFKLTLANNSLNRAEYLRHLCAQAETEAEALVMAKYYPHLVHPTELSLIKYELTIEIKLD